MTIEAMKLALDAIETYSPDYMHGLPKKDYVKALRAAIEQAEKQEPVATLFGSLPVYDTPQHKEWQGLTDEEIVKIASTPCAVVGSYVHTFARAIEAKLKEKNA